MSWRNIFIISRLNLILRNNDRKLGVASSISLIAILVIDTLTTRQILPYDNNSSYWLFVATILIGYAICPWILIGYSYKISKEIRSTSINRIILITAVVQFLLLLFFSYILVRFYIINTSTYLISSLALALSTTLACFVIGYIGLKFFLWYRSSHGKILLIYGLAASSIAVAIAFDGTAKLLLVQIIEEKPLSLTSKQPQQLSKESGTSNNWYDTFVYKNVDKYNGELQYKVVKPDGVTNYVVPSSISILYRYVNGWIPITVSFIFTWAITLITLRQYYRRKGNLPLSLYLILTLPVIFYIMGRIPELYTVFSGHTFTFDSMPNPYLFRIIFRVGVIGGSILFGLAFFMVSRRIKVGKIRDCITIAAIGATMIGISLSPSALQQTYGVASRSLMLLSCFLFSLGFYLSAVYLSQDSALRKKLMTMISKDYKDSKGVLEILDLAGKAEAESEIEKKVRNILKERRDILEQESGVILPQPEDQEIGLYIREALEELKVRKE